MITDQNILNDLLEWYTDNWHFNSNMAKNFMHEIIEDWTPIELINKASNKD